MYTLGIETSCDETSCAVLKNYRVCSNVTISSLRQHKRYGGIVPEIATRAHLTNIDKVLAAALEQAGVSLKKIGLIAVTRRPGLIGSLVVGLNFAKGLSLSLGRPWVGVNHLRAHLFAPFLNGAARFVFPFLGLVVSGGHSEIYRVDDFDKIKLIGATRDDACGEVFDKVARSFDLGYPGGPVIDRLYEPRLKDAFNFKCGRIGFDLSFSGIKTAVVYKKMELEKTASLDRRCRLGLLSSFQHRVVETVAQAVIEAALKFNIRRVVCGGGVMANRLLRRRLKEKEKLGVRVLISPRCYATDNAAMVAGLGFYLYNKKGIKSKITLQAEAN